MIIFIWYFVCLVEMLYIVVIVLCKCIRFSILFCKKIWLKDKRKYSNKLRILNDVKKYIDYKNNIKEWILFCELRIYCNF